MKGKFTVILLLFSPLFSLQGKAQSYSYLHDNSKMNQITVMELGAGTLTPAIYYNLFHKNYKKTALLPTSSKNTLRINAFMASSDQVEFADSIEADLEKRAKVEALNLADRQIDVAWQTMGNKINNKLRLLKNNINSLNGKTNHAEIEEWNNKTKQYEFAIKCMKKAYVANANRQQQYMAIYNEINTSNEYLLQRVRYLALKVEAEKIASSMSGNTIHRVKEESTAAYNRWAAVSEKIKSNKPESNKQ